MCGSVGYFSRSRQISFNRRVWSKVVIYATMLMDLSVIHRRFRCCCLSIAPNTRYSRPRSEDFDFESSSSSTDVNPGMLVLQKLREAQKYLEHVGPFVQQLSLTRTDPNFGGEKLWSLSIDLKNVIADVALPSTLPDAAISRELQLLVDKVYHIQ